MARNTPLSDTLALDEEFAVSFFAGLSAATRLAAVITNRALSRRQLHRHSAWRDNCTASGSPESCI